MRGASASLVLLAVLLGASRAAAQEPPTDRPTQPTVRLHHDVLLDGVTTAALGGLLVTWKLARSSSASSDCVICDGENPGDANSIDEWFRNGLERRDSSAAESASDVLAYGVGPAMGLGLTYVAAAADHRTEEAPLNALLVLEASLAAIAVNEAFGVVFRRERPEPESTTVESFPSGHTASIMAITSATATVATLRGYRLAPLVWIIGTTLGLTSTYLRIAADQSYFTDNVAGAAIGLGVGAGIPLLFHGRVNERQSAATRWLHGTMLRSSAVPGGRVVGLGWSF